MSAGFPKTRPTLSRIIEVIGGGEELSGPERHLLTVLASHAGGFARWSYPGYARLARLTGYKPRSIARLVVSCEAKGWLLVKRQEKDAPQKSNEYRVTPSEKALARVARRARPTAPPPISTEQEPPTEEDDWVPSEEPDDEVAAE